jgi:predicted DNA-binding transcriptional regulator YafY
MDVQNHFKDVIGVTIPVDDVCQVKFKVYGNRRHYVATKKIHKSQVTLSMSDDHALFSIHVKPNNEMYSLFLGFGGDLEVMEPENVREVMKELIKKMVARY